MLSSDWLLFEFFCVKPLLGIHCRALKVITYMDVHFQLVLTDWQTDWLSFYWLADWLEVSAATKRWSNSVMAPYRCFHFDRQLVGKGNPTGLVLATALVSGFQRLLASISLFHILFIICLYIECIALLDRFENMPNSLTDRIRELFTVVSLMKIFRRFPNISLTWLVSSHRVQSVHSFTQGSLVHWVVWIAAWLRAPERRLYYFNLSSWGIVMASRKR